MIPTSTLIALAIENEKWPDELVEVPKRNWPPLHKGHVRPARVFRSKPFLVQVFDEHYGMTRLTVCRTSLNPETGGYEENITWEDLQSLKRQAGYGDADAVEVFPADEDVVNVANMRHLWVLPYKLIYAWRKDRGGKQ